MPNVTFSDFRLSHRQTLVSATGTSEGAWGAVIRHFLLGLASLCAAIASLNYVVNPMGLYSIHIVPTSLWNARQQKAQLIKATYCQAIILGSSHAMKLSPAIVQQLTGLKTFNAAVDMATVEDDFVILRDSVEGNNWRIRLALIAVDPETFNPDAPVDPALKSDPELSRFFIRSHSAASLTWQEMTALLSVEQTSFSLQTLLWHLRGAPSDHHFDSDGYLHYDLMEHARNSGTFRLTTTIDRSDKRLAKRYQNFTRLSDRRKDMFLDMLEYCRAHNINAKILVMPLHPLARASLSRTRYDQLLSDTISFARDAAAQEGAAFYDMSELRNFQGSSNAFYDGEHVDEQNARLILAATLRKSGDNAIQ